VGTGGEKNSLNVLNRIFEIAKDRISELKDKSIELYNPKNRGRKKTKKSESSLKRWD
jgi:hypothetical protein